jgi:hypothetical protein
MLAAWGPHWFLIARGATALRKMKMEHILAIEVICGSDEDTHWAQWLWPHGGVDIDQGYFVVERAVEPDSDFDKTVWASRSGQYYSCYGGIANCTLYRNRVEFTLAERGREHLQCGDLRIDYELDDVVFAQLRQILELVFEGLNQLIVVGPISDQ